MYPLILKVKMVVSIQAKLLRFKRDSCKIGMVVLTWEVRIIQENGVEKQDLRPCMVIQNSRYIRVASIVH